MGRPIADAEGMEEEEEEEDGDEAEEFAFPTDADGESWEDPSAEQGGVLLSLFEAVEAGDEAEVARLAPACRSWLEAGTLGPEGDTALHLAALYEHEDVFERLLEAGANPRARCAAEGSVLHDAASVGNVLLVSRLLSVAPDMVNCTDEDGETPLHLAARCGATETVAVLLNAEADKSVQSTDGRTPLMVVDPTDVATARLLAE